MPESCSMVADGFSLSGAVEWRLCSFPDGAQLENKRITSLSEEYAMDATPAAVSHRSRFAFWSLPLLIAVVVLPCSWRPPAMQQAGGTGSSGR